MHSHSLASLALSAPLLSSCSRTAARHPPPRGLPDRRACAPCGGPRPAGSRARDGDSDARARAAEAGPCEPHASAWPQRPRTLTRPKLLPAVVEVSNAQGANCSCPPMRCHRVPLSCHRFSARLPCICVLAGHTDIGAAQVVPPSIRLVDQITPGVADGRVEQHRKLQNKKLRLVLVVRRFR